MRPKANLIKLYTKIDRDNSFLRGYLPRLLCSLGSAADQV